MKEKYHSILFDLDGTLSDSLIGIENGIQYSLKKCGIKNVNPATIKKMIGTPLSKSLGEYFFGDDPKQIKLATTYFREYYNKKGVFESVLYRGVYKLIIDLQKISELYVITAKPTLASKTLLKFHKIEHCFNGVLGYEPQHINFKKSDLINSLNLNKNAIMIGDKQQDIEAGKQTNITTAGVLYGYGTRNEITKASPDFIVDSVEALRKLLL